MPSTTSTVKPVTVLYVPDPQLEPTPPRLLQFSFPTPACVRGRRDTKKDNLLFIRDLLPDAWKNEYKLPNVTPYHGNKQNKDLYILRLSKFEPQGGGEEFKFDKPNPLYDIWKPYFNTPAYLYGPFFVIRVAEDHGLITKTLTDLKLEDYFEHLVDEMPLAKNVKALYFPMDATQKPKMVLIESIFTDWVGDYDWSAKYGKHLPDCVPLLYEVNDTHIVLSFDEQKGQPLGENLNYSRWSKNHPNFPQKRNGDVLVLQTAFNALAQISVLADCTLPLKEEQKKKRSRTPPARVVAQEVNAEVVHEESYVISTQQSVAQPSLTTTQQLPPTPYTAEGIPADGSALTPAAILMQQQALQQMGWGDTAQQAQAFLQMQQANMHPQIIQQTMHQQQQLAAGINPQQIIQPTVQIVAPQQAPLVNIAQNIESTLPATFSRFSSQNIENGTPISAPSLNATPAPQPQPQIAAPQMTPQTNITPQPFKLATIMEALQALEFSLPDIPTKLQELQTQKNAIFEAYDKFMREAPLLTDSDLQARHDRVAQQLAHVLGEMGGIGEALAQMQRVQQLFTTIQNRINGIIQSLSTPNLVAIGDSIQIHCKALNENIAIGQHELKRIRDAIDTARRLRLEYRRKKRDLDTDDDEEEAELKLSTQQRQALEQQVQHLRLKLNKWHQMIQSEISKLLRKKYPLEYRIASKELEDAQLVEISKLRLSQEASELRDYLARKEFLAVSSRATGYRNWVPLTTSGHISLCERVSDKQRCILKRLPLNRLMILRVHNEIEMLLRFQNNPNIITVNSCFIEGDEVFLEMNFYPDSILWLKGKDVESLLRAPVDYSRLLQEESVQSRDDILHVVNQLIETLKYLHMHGVEHRDLKPQNMLVEPDSNLVRLIDFGISKDHQQDLVQTSLMTTQQTAGTMRYLAPECKGNGSKQVIFARDVYALGVILFEFFAPPQYMDNVTVLHSGAGSVDELLPSKGFFTGWIRDLALRCLDRDPVRRPSTAEVHQLVQKYIAAEKKQILSQIIPRNSKLSMVKTFLQTASKRATENNLTHNFPVTHQEEIHKAILSHLSHVRDGDLETLLVRWKFQFSSQGGIDYGGLSNYAHTMFVEKFISSEYMEGTNSVFRLKEDPKLAPLYRDIGKMMLRCLLLELPVPWKLSRFVFSHLVGQQPPSTLEDMLQCISEYDSVFVRNIRAQLDNPASMGCSSRQEAAQLIMQDYLHPHLFGTNNGVLRNMDALREGFYCCVDGRLQQVRQVIESLSGFELKMILCDEHEDFDRGAMVATLERSLTHSFWDETPNRKRTREWIKQWLQNSDFMSLKRMLMLMTSFPSYVAGRNLILTPSNSNRFYGHTCANNMEVACDLGSYQEFESKLDNVLISMQFSSFEEY